MLSSVLTSRRAVEVNIVIMRTFVRLRQLAATQEELTRRVEKLEWHDLAQDGQIQAVFDAMQNLIDAPVPEHPKRRIGYLHTKE